MQQHQKKMIAPIIVTVLLVLYYVVYFSVLLVLVTGIWRILLAVIPFAFSVVIVKVCIERIHEIKEGEEDDLSQY